MAFPRISDRIPAPDHLGRTLRTTALAALAALAVLAGTAVEAADTVPPGATPCFSNAVPAGYGSFLLLKSATFAQSPGSAPAASGALASMELRPPAAYGISNALVTGPSSFKATLARAADGTSAWSQSGTEAGLQATLPAGAWSTSFQLVFPEGDTFVGFFPFLLASNLPPVPEVLNLAAAQSIDAAAPFTLTWNPWIGTSANDRISLQVLDAAGRTVFSAASDCTGSTGLLPGAGSVAVPAGALSAATAYTAHLTFGANLLAAQDDSTFIVERGYQSRTTQFPLHTAGGGGGGQPGDLLNPTISGTNLVFTVKGTPGTTYAVESTADLATWTRELTVTLPASGQAEVRIPLAASGDPRFYRATSLGGTTPQVDPATLAVSLVGTDRLRLVVTGTPGGVYSIESSDAYTAWTKVAEVTLPAAANSATVEIPIAATTPFLAFRATGVGGTTEPPVTTQPILAIGTPVAAGADLQTTLRLTGGAANRNYTVQSTAALGSWANSPQTIATDAQGNGQTTLTLRTGATFTAGPTAFYRVSLP